MTCDGFHALLLSGPMRARTVAERGALAKHLAGCRACWRTANLLLAVFPLTPDERRRADEDGERYAAECRADPEALA